MEICGIISLPRLLGAVLVSGDWILGLLVAAGLSGGLTSQAVHKPYSYLKLYR